MFQNGWRWELYKGLGRVLRLQLYRLSKQKECIHRGHIVLPRVQQVPVQTMLGLCPWCDRKRKCRQMGAAVQAFTVWSLSKSQGQRYPAVLQKAWRGVLSSVCTHRSQVRFLFHSRGTLCSLLCYFLCFYCFIVLFLVLFIAVLCYSSCSLLFYCVLYYFIVFYIVFFIVLLCSLLFHCVLYCVLYCFIVFFIVFFFVFSLLFYILNAANRHVCVNIASYAAYTGCPKAMYLKNGTLNTSIYWRM